MARISANMVPCFCIVCDNNLGIGWLPADCPAGVVPYAILLVGAAPSKILVNIL